MSKKTYTPAFKAKVVLEVLQGESELSAIASKYDLNPNMVRTRLLITKLRAKSLLITLLTQHDVGRSQHFSIWSSSDGIVRFGWLILQITCSQCFFRKWS